MSALNDARDEVKKAAKSALEIVNSTTMTAAEQKTALDKADIDIKKWTEEVRNLEHVENRRKEIFGNTDGHDAAGAKDSDFSNESWGAQFVKSKGYENLKSRGLGGGRFTTGDVELKATLTEGGAGGGAAFVATPNVLPGILPVLNWPLVVADLIPSSATDSVLIRYLVETAYTNAAAVVAEGALKPESAIAFDKRDETIHKLATFLPVSDEMLEDVSQIQGYINGRLQLFVKIAEQAELLNGDGTGEHLLGLLNRLGLATPVVKGTAPSAAGDNSMDALYRQFTAIRTTAFLEPDAIVIDPVSWENILLAKNLQGAYYANGPFTSQEPAMVWGKKVVITPAMTTGTALVGCFAQGAQIFRKGGLTVEASNSHADFFQRNLTALRAEERLGLACYRPQGFGLVSGL